MNTVLNYYSQTREHPQVPIGSDDLYYNDARDNKISSVVAIFVNARNVQVSGTIIKPQRHNDKKAVVEPDYKGGFKKNRYDTGRNVSINFSFLVYGSDLLRHMEIHQCTSKVWIARKLRERIPFFWDPMNDIGQHAQSNNSVTLLIATVLQMDPRAQYPLDVSIRNKETYQGNNRIRSHDHSPPRTRHISGYDFT